MKKIRTILDLEDGDRFFVEKGGHKLMKIRQINTAAKGNAVDLVTGDNKFPTRWLWEDYRAEFEAEVEKYKNEAAQKKERQKTKRADKKQAKALLIESIKSKLTVEELKAIGLKP